MSQASLSRRGALIAALGIVASSVLGSVPARAADDPPRWNILFVFADDWGRFASCYRGLDGRPTLNDVVATPHIDQVAAEGVVFRNAFVNAPSCTPCRSSLMSGRYFFNTGLGAILQGAHWDSSIPSFPLLLRDAGYHIGKSYKVWSPGDPVDAPFGGQQYAYEQAGRAPCNFSEEATARVEKGLTVAQAREEIMGQVRDNFDQFLAARSGKEPWLYYFGTTTTHRKWIKGSGKDLWGIDPDALEGKMPAFLPDVPEVRQDVADYLGECQAVDACVGVLMDRLRASGELDNTLVVLSGDHGLPGVPSGKCNLYDFGVAVPLIVRVPGVAGGRVVDDFTCLPDLAPTFMETGGVTPPEGLYGRSLLPVLTSSESGQVDPSRTWVITGRERHVAAAREGNLPYPMRSLRNARYAYVRNFAPDRWPMGGPGQLGQGDDPSQDALENDTFAAFSDMDSSPTKAWIIAHRTEPEWSWFHEHAFGKRPLEELYDVVADPDMVKNLAADPAHAAVKAEMASQLLDTLERAGDPRVIGDGQTFDRPPFSAPLNPAAPTRKAARKKAGVN